MQNQSIISENPESMNIDQTIQNTTCILASGGFDEHCANEEVITFGK